MEASTAGTWRARRGRRGRQGEQRAAEQTGQALFSGRHGAETRRLGALSRSGEEGARGVGEAERSRAGGRRRRRPREGERGIGVRLTGGPKVPAAQAEREAARGSAWAEREAGFLPREAGLAG